MYYIRYLMKYSGNLKIVSVMAMCMALGSIYSCKKDIDPTLPQEMPPPPPPPLSMVAGDTVGMEVIHFDTIFNGVSWNSSVNHFIDIAGGPPSIRLYFYFTSSGAVGTGQARSLSISSNIGTMWFNGYFQNDTIRSSVDSLLQYDSSWTYPYHLFLTYTFGCGLGADEPVDTVLVDSFHPFLYSSGELIDTTAYQDVGSFTDKARLNWTTMGSALNDSTFLQGEFDYLNNCLDLEPVEPFFVAFKMRTLTSFRRGWVKLQMAGPWSIRVDHVALEP